MGEYYKSYQNSSTQLDHLAWSEGSFDREICLCSKSKAEE